MTSSKKKEKEKVARKGFKHVIVGTDFSPGARLALRRAQHLPFEQGADIVLIHILPKENREVDAPTVEAIRRERMQREITTLERAFSRLGRDDIRIQAEFREGSPTAELSAAASRHHAELLVVGRRGESSLRKFLLGSTAEQLANVARCEVLVVGRRATGPYRLPLVALPPEPETHYVLDAAMRMLPGLRLHVITAVHVQMEAWLWGGGPSTREILALRSAARKRAKELVNAELAPHRAEGARFLVSFFEGEPRQVLLAKAAQCHADLLVLGKRKKGRRSHLRIGSVAAQVLRSARSDVLIASAPSHTSGETRKRT